MRDEAVAYVRQGWNEAKWSQWSDVHKLIEEQDGVADALEEGLEAFGEHAATDSDSDSDSDSVAEDGIDGATGSGGPATTSSETSLVAAASEAVAMSVAPAPLVAAASEAGVMSLAAARQVLYNHAKRSGDDVTLRHVRRCIQTESQAAKDSSTKIGVMLMEKNQAVRDAERKANLDRLNEDRLAAKDLEDVKHRRAAAEKAAADARLACLKQALANRQDAQLRKQRDIVARKYKEWLQTQYPATLARRLIRHKQGLSAASKANFTRTISLRLQDRTFQRPLFLQDLWTADSTFTNVFAQVRSRNSGPHHDVRCSTYFMEAVVSVVAPPQHSGHQPVEILFRIFEACVPSARKIFDTPFNPLRLLERSDFVLDKAFVFGIICLSKWLGRDQFPNGVFTWPPPAPNGFETEWAQHPAHMHAVGSSASSSGGAIVQQ